MLLTASTHQHHMPSVAAFGDAAWSLLALVVLVVVAVSVVVPMPAAV